MCVAEFLENLFIKADFEGAQQKLKECEELIENDYFLTAMKAEFVENARWFIFENYCRIHQCIDLPMLAQNLGMPVEAAERWIVNLIRWGLIMCPRGGEGEGGGWSLTGGLEFGVMQFGRSRRVVARILQLLWVGSLVLYRELEVKAAERCIVASLGGALFFDLGGRGVEVCCALVNSSACPEGAANRYISSCRERERDLPHVPHFFVGTLQPL